MMHAYRSDAEPASRIETVRRVAVEGDASSADDLNRALADADPTVRRLATYGLQRIGDSIAVPALAAMLGDEDAWVRRTAATALGKLRSREATPWLVDVLADDDVRLRYEAFVALGRIGDPAVCAGVIAALRDGRIWRELPSWDQIALLHVVERDWFDDTAVVPVLEWLLTYDEWDHPELAADDPARRDRLLMLVPNMAARILAEKFGSDAGERWLVAGLSSTYAMQQSSARALGRIRSARAVPALLDVVAGIREREKEGRGDLPTLRYLVEALGGIGDAAALPALEGALVHDDIRIRRTAAVALEKIDGVTREVVPEGPAAVPPVVGHDELGTPGGRRPPQFIVLGVDDCVNIEGLEAMLDIIETLRREGAGVVFTMWLSPLMADAQTRDMLKQGVLIQRLFDLGCEIAHHTLHHNPGGRNWGSLSREVQIEEVEGCTRWYRENIEGFTRPFSHKGGGGGRGERVDPEFTEQLLARQDFLYRAFRPGRFGPEHPHGLHPNEITWPEPEGFPLTIPTSALDANAPPVHGTLTHGIRGNIPGNFDFDVPRGAEMMVANLDYLYNHPRRPIFAVNAYHDWGFKTLDDSLCTRCHRNEAPILKEFLLEVLVRRKEKYPDVHCVTFRQVVEYIVTGGDLEQSLAIGNGQDSRNPVRPAVE